MVGVGTAVAIVVASVAVGVVAGAAAIISTAISADAQKEVAETNARATVEAARSAANAQMEAAKEDANARKHEADVAYQQEMEYLKFEKWAMNNEDDMDAYYQEMQNQIDTVDTLDTYYSDTGVWCSGGYCYDYGSEEATSFS